MNNCLNCTYAKWLRTINGRLHPDKRGQCTYSINIIIPKAFYWIGSPQPNGGYLERNRPYEDCPTWRKGEFPIIP